MYNSVETLLNKWKHYYHLFLNEGDRHSADKLMELMIKANHQEWIVTFCGHYSAGKSSMINYLLQTNILPTSPIPTTANVIEMRNGKDCIRIHTHENKVVEYSETTDVKAVLKSYEKLQEIRKMEIHTDNLPIDESTIYMDTPGIDSTDQAHLLAAESSIHLADLLFYIVDYNHVQAELNLQFTKQLVTNGKSFVLIVNQMDKFREEEISLVDFKNSVVNSFRSYGVVPEAIIYTSLKKEGVFKEEVDNLAVFISKKMREKERLLPVTLSQSFQKIVKDHIKWKKNQYQEKVENLLERLDGEIEINGAIARKELHRLQGEMVVQQDNYKELSQKVEKELLSIIQHAYIMPFHNRELAATYLQSVHKKTSFFSSKKKQEKERIQHLNDWYQAIQKTIQVQLVTPIIHLFEKLEFSEGSMWNDIKDKIQASQLESLVNKEAQLSETYTIVYCETVENYVKNQVKKEVLPTYQQWEEKLHKLLNEKQMVIKQEITKWKKYDEICKQKEIVDSKWNEWEQCIYVHLPKMKEEALCEKEFLDTFQKKVEYRSLVSESDHVENERMVEEKKKNISASKGQISVEGLIQQLQYGSNKLQHITGFAHQAKSLLSKAEAMKNRQYTICLFGAFSAGKSSFANALLNYSLLPVSPNPTTATINRILPVDPINKNGTVIVKWKTEKEMLKEMNDYLQLVQQQASTLLEAKNILTKLQKKTLDYFVKEFRYLDAFINGYTQNSQHLGTELETTIKNLTNYVSVEEVSCFIASIDVYFDCEITRKGIILVDTPGGDSINSRHTELSFNYMKEADSILYVTYYNHAFSKADQSFLTQLGRLKDAFEKDKLFFLINAIDLADNEEERRYVQRYVMEQLQLYGIIQPRILPVSSLFYKDKQYRKWMNEAKNTLFRFIEEEWMELMVQSAFKEYTDVLHQLDSLLATTLKQKHSRLEIQKQMKRDRLSCHSLVSDLGSILPKESLKREIEEQLFFVNQRIFYRFNEWMKESFHPSILKGKDKKREAYMATTQFLLTINYELEQELRATSVRLDRHYEYIKESIYKQLVERLKEVNENVCIQINGAIKSDRPLTFKGPFKQIESDVGKIVLSFYKSPKRFFEQNERKSMAEEMEKMMKKKADLFMKEEIDRISFYYQEQLEKELRFIRQEAGEQIDDSFEGTLALLEEDSKVEQLKVIIRDLKENRYIIEK